MGMRTVVSQWMRMEMKSMVILFYMYVENI